MSLQRGMDDSEPVRPDPIESVTDLESRRRVGRPVAHGTLACPSCDAPVFLPRGTAAPTDLIGCSYCDAYGAVRDFLSLEPPTRPTRVVVRVRMPVLR